MSDFVALANQPDLRKTEQLSRIKYPRCAALANSVVRDYLNDVARGIMKVNGACIPVLELEDDLAGLAVGQQIKTCLRPPEGGVETVTGGKECKVVEGPSRGLVKGKGVRPIVTSPWSPPVLAPNVVA